VAAAGWRIENDESVGACRHGVAASKTAAKAKKLSEKRKAMQTKRNQQLIGEMANIWNGAVAYESHRFSCEGEKIKKEERKYEIANEMKVIVMQ